MSGSNTVKCGGCGKQYRWDAKLAGKAVKCGCGQRIEMPAAAPMAERPAAAAERKKESAAPTPASRACPSCGAAVAAAAAICIKCGTNLKTGSKAATRVTAASTDAESKAGGGRKPLVIGAVAAAVIAVALIVIFSGGGDPTPTPPGGQANANTNTPPAGDTGKDGAAVAPTKDDTKPAPVTPPIPDPHAIQPDQVTRFFPLPPAENLAPEAALARSAVQTLLSNYLHMYNNNSSPVYAPAVGALVLARIKDEAGFRETLKRAEHNFAVTAGKVIGQRGTPYEDLALGMVLLTTGDRAGCLKMFEAAEQQYLWRQGNTSHSVCAPLIHARLEIRDFAGARASIALFPPKYTEHLAALVDAVEAMGPAAYPAGYLDEQAVLARLIADRKLDVALKFHNMATPIGSRGLHHAALHAGQRDWVIEDIRKQGQYWEGKVLLLVEYDTYHGTVSSQTVEMIALLPEPDGRRNDAPLMRAAYIQMLRTDAEAAKLFMQKSSRLLGSEAPNLAAVGYLVEKKWAPQEVAKMKQQMAQAAARPQFQKFNAQREMDLAVALAELKAERPEFKTLKELVAEMMASATEPPTLSKAVTGLMRTGEQEACLALLKKAADSNWHSPLTDEHMALAIDTGQFDIAASLPTSIKIQPAYIQRLIHRGRFDHAARALNLSRDRAGGPPEHRTTDVYAWLNLARAILDDADRKAIAAGKPAPYGIVMGK